MRTDLIYGEKTNKDSYRAPTPEPTVHIPPRPAEERRIVYATPASDSFKTHLKIAAFLFLLNTGLNTEPGMMAKKTVADAGKYCLEMVVGKNEAKGFCHAVSHTARFVSGYIDKTLTWIDYKK